ncbi:MAG: hypothetical protein HRF49_11690 [bacterium]
MPDQLAKLEQILTNAKLKFERSKHDETTELLSAVLNAENDLRLDIIALLDADGYELKFVAYLDGVDATAAADQLRDTLALNFIMALGRFAYQPDIDAVVYVADYPLMLLDDDTFQSILDEYYYFANLYFEQRYGSARRLREFAGPDEDTGVSRIEPPGTAEDQPQIPAVDLLKLKLGSDIEEGHD